MRVKVLKMSTRSPLGSTSLRILSSAISLDEAATMCSSTVSSPSGSELGSRYGCEQLWEATTRAVSSPCARQRRELETRRD